MFNKVTLTALVVGIIAVNAVAIPETLGNAIKRVPSPETWAEWGNNVGLHYKDTYNSPDDVPGLVHYKREEDISLPSLQDLVSVPIFGREPSLMSGFPKATSTPIEDVTLRSTHKREPDAPKSTLDPKPKGPQSTHKRDAPKSTADPKPKGPQSTHKRDAPKSTVDPKPKGPQSTHKRDAPRPTSHPKS